MKQAPRILARAGVRLKAGQVNAVVNDFNGGRVENTFRAHTVGHRFGNGDDSRNTSESDPVNLTEREKRVARQDYSPPSGQAGCGRGEEIVVRDVGVNQLNSALPN
ncbi:MAG TPA: hypothetical protein VK422_07425 [Pyrinomonadaceae bacterium]|nr:hypothetical protein [Pyrinomonadaceae bacterium]